MTDQTTDSRTLEPGRRAGAEPPRRALPTLAAVVGLALIAACSEPDGHGPDAAARATTKANSTSAAPGESEPPSGAPSGTPSAVSGDAATASAEPLIPLLPSGPATAAAVPGERLLAEPPVGWDELFSTERKGFRLVEYVPVGSPVEWTEKLSFEAVAGDKPDLIAFADSIATDQKEVCERFEDHNTFTGYENQYETTVRLYACTNNPGLGRGQITMLKAVVGDDYFYTVTWAKRVRPFRQDEPLPVAETEIARWSSYLRRIKVCNDRSAAHPCPAKQPAEDSADGALADRG